jgi:protein-S-isoprenylcysteine O-methyltransferase Ste14
MPIVALAVYAVYVAIAFGLRAAIHYRHTGTTGFVGVSGSPFSIEWLAGVTFGVAAIAGGLLAPLAQLNRLVDGWSGPVSGVGYALGFVFALFGIAMTFSAQLAMGRSWRVGVNHEERTELVSSGPYRWVRNPIYTWMTLVNAGLVMLAPNVIAVTAFVTLVLALEVQVRAVEEPHLLRVHGDAYRRYAAHTGRFVPGVGRLR